MCGKRRAEGNQGDAVHRPEQELRCVIQHELKLKVEELEDYEEDIQILEKRRWTAADVLESQEN